MFLRSACGAFFALLTAVGCGGQTSSGGAVDGAAPDSATVDAAADVSTPRDAGGGDAFLPPDVGVGDAAPDVFTVPDATTDGNGPDCGCPAGTICVGTRTVGGAQIVPSDGGSCPPGTNLEGGNDGPFVCVQDFSYVCMAPPAACDAAITCACAGPNYCSSFSTCLDPMNIDTNGALAPGAVLVCQFDAP
jgi:hypothetical protein